ncbi:MAG: FadR/GntR family transcriptional regulator [Halothiobacillaceae bacterium]
MRSLGERIVGGSYPTGSTLPSEEVLCQELGVSRTALREAVKVLAAQGLLKARPRIGTRVQPVAAWNMLDPEVLAWRCAADPAGDMLRQLGEIREIIEPNACMLAARNRSAGDLLAIEQACQAMRDSQVIEEWVGADLRFHVAVLEATHNELLIPLSSVIGSALGMLLGVSARRADSFKQALDDHLRIFQAIRDQDQRAAFMRMQRLLADTRRRLE